MAGRPPWLCPNICLFPTCLQMERPICRPRNKWGSDSPWHEGGYDTFLAKKCWGEMFWRISEKDSWLPRKIRGRDDLFVLWTLKCLTPGTSVLNLWLSWASLRSESTSWGWQNSGKNLNLWWCYWAAELSSPEAPAPANFFLYDIIHFLTVQFELSFMFLVVPNILLALTNYLTHSITLCRYL